MLDIFFMLGVFVFSFAIGHVLIWKVPQLLHTPLMSMTNAISAVTVVGALLLFASETTLADAVLGAAAIALAAFNLVGGFLITDRMLRLFKDRSNGL
ncbi:MAG: NAD(P) transhydrogenase subunit alpha [Deltaproteobacteria bacterium]|nr:NAD(P) transhydrogenase subunit alpha [Deltaproteobacteria bacterium]